MGMLENPHEWHEDGITHKLVKLVRYEVKGKFECRNRVTSVYVLKELARKLRQAHLRRSLIYYILCGALEKCADLFEIARLRAFIDKSTMDKVVRHLMYLPRNKERKRESVLMQRNACPRPFPTSLPTVQNKRW
ncbi:hypothetical protein, unlikely [Trypanosoma congolense IL3000]|uniref:Retrotransposon hot spot protein,C-terminal domain-containing protein n=1 Tax=Trypanosoma congolense (strain IL3000) TaxID=1068625 RepID=F9WGK2_TRYCI|nr:hypothetical protein, unlikely [Trypanosoma congolense IL3000]